jgi:RNA polymerase sigma-70 factor (ECF subfamily)
VLILRDVLGFSGAEVAAALDTTPASVYSLLQRAHASLDDRLPERSQQATLRSLGDQRLSAIVDRYVESWAHNDVDALVEMLTESATLSMPPTASWLRGRDAIATSLSARPLNGTQSWRLLPTSANGQPATGAYLLDTSGAYPLHHLAVITLRGERIDEINAFHDLSAPERFGLPART